MEIKRGLVMVIHEKDLSDKEEIVIGVATNREEALRMIKEYYGVDKEVEKLFDDDSQIDIEAVISDFRDIRENNLDFSCIVTVSGFLGGVYKVWAEDFVINQI